MNGGETIADETSAETTAPCCLNDPATACSGLAGEQADAAGPNPGAPRLDGCPTPLAWQQVLRSFREDSTPWKLDRGRYTLEGRSWGAGPPLYFLNGMGGTCELYALLVWLLRDRYRCVLYDYPGTQAPVRGLSRITLADFSGDLLAVADHFGDEKFRVIATSFGTLVALTAIAAKPNRIEQAIIVGGFARRDLSWPERMLVRVCPLLPMRLAQVPLAQSIQRQNHRPWFPPFDQTRWQFFLENAGQLPVPALCHRGALIRDADLRPLLPQIHCPTLLVHGEGDGLVSNRCHAVLESGLPHATSELLANSGHLPYLTHPHRLAKVVSAFFSPSDAVDNGSPKS